MIVYSFIIDMHEPFFFRFNNEKNMKGYKSEKSECIVIGYSREFMIPKEIIKMIFIFFDDLILFNVFGKNGKNIINNCRNIFINGEAYFFISNDNVFYCSGNNDRCQLGLDSSLEYVNVIEHGFFKEKDIQLLSDSINNDHVIICASDVLYGMGNNLSNQLGIETSSIAASFPTAIEYKFPSKLKSIKCGYSHSLFLTDHGNVYGCGGNMHNQLSNKYTNQSSIQCIINTGNVIQIDCSHFTSFILYNDNKLYSFGSNLSGMLGRNDTTKIQCGSIGIVFNGEFIKIFCCGAYHFGSIKLMDNKLYMFGGNENAQCGLTKDNHHSYSGNLIDIKNETIIQLRCGKDWNIIKTDHNNWYSFGCNDDGLLLIKSEQSPVFSPKLILPEYIHELTGLTSDILDIIPTWNDNLIIQKSSEI